jgi:hypothetical protein
MYSKYSTSSKKSRSQFIYDRKGHRCASVRDGILFRSLHERGLLHNPEACAFDLVALEAARQAGAHTVIIHRQDVRVKMRARLEDYYALGWEFDYGFGLQRGLSLSCFEVIEGKPSEKVEQFALPLGI